MGTASHSAFSSAFLGRQVVPCLVSSPPRQGLKPGAGCSGLIFPSIFPGGFPLAWFAVGLLAVFSYHNTITGYKMQ